MVQIIYGPQEHHGVRTVAEYRRRHARAIAEKAAHGFRAAVHLSTEPCVARIDTGSWLVDCECGAGNATDPAWGVALCFGCGAVHDQVIFPPPKERAAIVSALLARPQPRTRGWLPGQGETAKTLRAENVAHGIVEVTDGVV